MINSPVGEQYIRAPTCYSGQTSRSLMSIPAYLTRRIRLRSTVWPVGLTACVAP